MYRVLANMGELLSKQRVSLPPEAIAKSEVRNEARLLTCGSVRTRQAVRPERIPPPVAGVGHRDQYAKRATAPGC